MSRCNSFEVFIHFQGYYISYETYKITRLIKNDYNLINITHILIALNIQLFFFIYVIHNYTQRVRHNHCQHFTISLLGLFDILAFGMLIFWLSPRHNQILNFLKLCMNCGRSTNYDFVIEECTDAIIYIQKLLFYKRQRGRGRNDGHPTFGLLLSYIHPFLR